MGSDRGQDIEDLLVEVMQHLLSNQADSLSQVCRTCCFTSIKLVELNGTRVCRETLKHIRVLRAVRVAFMWERGEEGGGGGWIWGSEMVHISSS